MNTDKMRAHTAAARGTTPPVLIENASGPFEEAINESVVDSWKAHDDNEISMLAMPHPGKPAMVVVAMFGWRDGRWEMSANCMDFSSYAAFCHMVGDTLRQVALFKAVVDGDPEAIRMSNLAEGAAASMRTKLREQFGHPEDNCQNEECPVHGKGGVLERIDEQTGLTGSETAAEGFGQYI